MCAKRQTSAPVMQSPQRVGWAPQGCSNWISAHRVATGVRGLQKAGYGTPEGPILSYPAVTLGSSVEEGRWQLPYEDMAHSHVKELVRWTYRLDEVVVDRDGDLPFPCGTAMFYLSVVRRGRLLRVWARAVEGTRINKPVLREINDVNAGLTFARVWATDDAVWVEGFLPVDLLRVRELRALCREVGHTADRLGSMLAAVHGGQVTFPEGAEHDHEQECQD